MRKLIILLLFFICNFTYAQISYVSKNKDTLILPMNDIGLKIYQVWFEYTDKPVILFTESKYIAILNKRKDETEYESKNN